MLLGVLIAPTSEIVARLFCNSLPVVESYLVMALSAELAGPNTSPLPEPTGPVAPVAPVAPVGPAGPVEP